MSLPAHLRVLALGVAFVVSACDKPAASEEALFGAIYENVHALETKDVATVMSTIHPQSPVYAGTREAIEEMFSSVDLKYALSDLRIESVTPEEVKVSFVQRTEKVGGAAPFSNNIVEGIHTLRLDGRRWKIYKTLQTKITDFKGKPLFAPDAPPPTSPIPPADQLPPAPPTPGKLPPMTPLPIPAGVN